MTTVSELERKTASELNRTRAEVEDLLYLEAELLDEWDLDEWARLYTDDAHYIIPANDCPEADPSRDLVLVDDNAFRIRGRIERLKSRKAHREYPHATTRHMVSNIRVRGVVGDRVHVSAYFTVWRFRNGRDDHYVGRYDYRLRRVNGELRIAYKRAVMDMTHLRPTGTVSIIL